MRIFILLFFICSSLCAQFDMRKFPFSPYQEPIHIRAKIILLTKDNGEGNFDLNDNQAKNDLLNFLDNVNNVYSNFHQPDDLTNCYTGNEFYKDARIRFDFEIVEVKNEYGWDFTNTGTDLSKNIYRDFSPHPSWYLKSVDDSITKAEMKINKPSVHIYFTNNGKIYEKVKINKHKNYNPIGKAASQFPSIQDFGRSSQVHMPNIWLKYIYIRYQAMEDFNYEWERVINWFMKDARSLAHELGHTLGLYHHNNYHGTNKCPFSIMSQKGAAPRNYLQPTEIRKIHWNLSHTNLMQFVKDDAYNNTNHLVYDELIIHKPTRWYGGFELSNKAKLIVRNKLIMPYDSKIILNRRAILQFEDKGEIVFPDGTEYTNFVKGKEAKIIHKKNDCE